MSIPPYEKNNRAHQFFFHPLSLKQKPLRALSVVVQVLFTAVTGGIWLIPLCVVRQLDRKKIEVWKKEQAERFPLKPQASPLSPNSGTITMKPKALQYVHLVGDSTLDNCYWFLGNQSAQQAKELSVKGQLKKLFEDKGIKVKNHAYDGFTTNSLLNGDTIGSVLPGGKTKKDYMGLRQKRSEAFIKPLDKLKASIEKAPEAEHRVVLSVGGNDFRVLLREGPQKLLGEIPNVQNRYLKVVEEIKKIQGKVKIILCFQYKTVADKNQDHYRIYPIMAQIGKTLLGASPNLPSSEEEIAHAAFEEFHKRFYRPIVEQAKKDHLPILDLSSTFDPKDNDLYLCGIEPSEKGGQLIAEGIHHIVTHHFEEGQASVRYAKAPGSQAYARVN
jgi:hypothetical protein